jgi:anti-sigma factor RsiW
MKPKVSEMDLTDYALNELGPEDRIYVETYLAGSEEAREDVYGMIDLAMMLEEGFEREERNLPAELTAEQHRAVLSVPGPNIFLRNTIALLAAAACVAFAVVQRDAWMPRLQLPQTAGTTLGGSKTGKMAKPGAHGAQVKVTSEQTDFVNQIRHFQDFTDDPLLRRWFQSLPSASSPTPVVNATEGMPPPLETFESLM